MCGIIGAIATKSGTLSVTRALTQNTLRGRDAWGYWNSDGTQLRENRSYYEWAVDNVNVGITTKGTLLANMRAEPTTEYVKDKQTTDVQPYIVGDYVIVHNGTIANDKELCAEHGWTPPTKIDSWVIAALCDKYGFKGMLDRIVGSYAIIAVNRTMPNLMFYACNYRPLYKHVSPEGLILSSVPVDKENDVLVKPYSWGTMVQEEEPSSVPMISLYPQAKPGVRKRALVVFSGGLDSTVAVASMVQCGYETELMHFDYSARATAPERIAVEAVAAHYGIPLHIVSTDIFKSLIGGSRLTGTKDTNTFAEAEAGAEYAHEWVPARNLILMSIAIGYAESKGFDYIALGANLEEAGAYPDNEPEFINQLNKLIPFAVGDGKQLSILTPVGNMMKHEIVAAGLASDAPMHLSWSCYDAEQDMDAWTQHGVVKYKHCGHCGPCFMRKTAFAINGAQDPVFAAQPAALAE